MMYQGLFGAIPFYVAEADICTFRDFKQSREMQFVEHKTLDGLGRLQHTGRSLDPISFNVIVVPMNQVYTVELRLRALDALSRLGQEMPLVIGLKYHAFTSSNPTKSPASKFILASRFPPRSRFPSWSTTDAKHPDHFHVEAVRRQDWRDRNCPA